MSRPSVRLKIDSERLRAAIGSKVTWSEIAEKYGVTRQAVNGWLSEGRIPPRALAEITKDLGLSPDTVKEILAPSEKEPKKKWVLTITLEEK